MTLDATIGGASANSYLTVAEADAIAVLHGMGDTLETWQKATTAQKEKALINATVDVDAVVTQAKAGAPWDIDQTLLFPRRDDVHEDVPFLIGNIRLAIYHQAAYRLHNAETLDGADSRRARNLIQFADDDGSGSLPAAMLAGRRDYSRYSADMLALLDAIELRRRTAQLYSIPVGR